MKKKEKYYPVNNQEDEDGYSLYPDCAVIDENINEEENENSSENNINTESMPENRQLYSFNHSQFRMQTGLPKNE